MATILDGKLIRDQILSELKPRVAALAAPPQLVVVLIGDDPASQVYVKNKIAACAAIGIKSRQLSPPASISTEDLLTLIRGLNFDPEVHGILVQLPLPPHVDAGRILEAVAPAKDVDGFHPINAGRLLAGAPGLRPCTPSGIMELLRRYKIPIEGRKAVVVGRSEIVGKPMAILLLQANATVTICHSRTVNLAEECKRADILVAAIGRAEYIGSDHIQPGAVVIDVGMNRVSGRLTGDVDPEAMARLSSAYTPVPGGVGPLTIAMLMANTVQAAENAG
ncbi:bifunctional methylenetetrahydrofolate dehydrogenase/methenyltetrahydrofolate cyclohydrolase FolD [Bryobacter aggregatus]|uniref:bifunctional methylenetetrahydrofolate dehydrogenase/methenyltetrahydrofolate cyclohydrolase FolD n=1 Tax=Bryobacter aggregatus TaxID=360054 RepID=UPI0004E206CD|nr:bifunctional methylenetetrahydrofolate dehydrogenase/methenyltetrahydrofolate cyclohydrolase FolD [Bryobacter aggregatus]